MLIEKKCMVKVIGKNVTGEFEHLNMETSFLTFLSLFRSPKMGGRSEQVGGLILVPFES